MRLSRNANTFIAALLCLFLPVASAFAAVTRVQVFSEPAPSSDVAPPAETAITVEEDPLATQLCVLGATRASCDASADCQWDEETNVCRALMCEWFSIEAACSATGKCAWDSNNSVCKKATILPDAPPPSEVTPPVDAGIAVEEDPLATQLCVLGTTRASCDASADCQWDEETNVCRALMCEWFSTEAACSATGKCFWNSNETVCRKVPSL